MYDCCTTGWICIRICKNKTSKLCTLAIKENVYSFKHVDEYNQTDEICLAAMNINGLILKYIINKTCEICLAATIQNSLALQYVKNQTYDTCLAAIKQNGLALQYVKKTIPDMCIAAIKMIHMQSNM